MIAAYCASSIFKTSSYSFFTIPFALSATCWSSSSNSFICSVSSPLSLILPQPAMSLRAFFSWSKFPLLPLNAGSLIIFMYALNAVLYISCASASLLISSPVIRRRLISSCFCLMVSSYASRSLSRASISDSSFIFASASSCAFFCASAAFFSCKTAWSSCLKRRFKRSFISSVRFL